MPYMGIELGKIIERLEKEDPKRPTKFGIRHPHSYRGFYEDLAVEPTGPSTIGEMLSVFRSAIGKTFQGWKGGQFPMDAYTSVWIAEEGDTSDDLIGPMLLEHLLE